VLPTHRAVVCVHGCFWHRHPGCRLASTPKSNEAFWQTKFATNVARDRRNQAALAAQGWNVVIVWECETAKPEELAERLDRRLRRVVEYAPPEESDLAVAAEDPPEYNG
jgi:DNA mismatch endonuclease (patch repair protein)